MYLLTCSLYLFLSIDFSLSPCVHKFVPFDVFDQSIHWFEYLKRPKKEHAWKSRIISLKTKTKIKTKNVCTLKLIVNFILCSFMYFSSIPFTRCNFGMYENCTTRKPCALKLSAAWILHFSCCRKIKQTLNAWRI